MGRIIAVTNLKGGIGKTTTVVNVGAGLALKGARVLLVDVDAQGNLAPALGVQPRRTIYEMLVDQIDPAKCITAARPNLDVIAADDSLLSAQSIISQRADWSRVLDQLLRPLKRSYDFIFVDAPGSLTVLSANAIAASNDLLVPTTVEHFSVKGLELLFKQVARLKTGTSSIRVIVPTMYDARLRQSGAVLEQLQQRYGTLLVPPIRINVRISEATALGKTIYEYDARSRGSLDYAHLVDRLSDVWGFQEIARTAHKKPPPANGNGNGNGNGHHPPPAAPAPPATLAEPDAIKAALHNAATAPPAPKPQPAAPASLVMGAGTTTSVCPHCGRPLQRVMLAGYRVVFCDHCKYKHQELASRR